MFEGKEWPWGIEVSVDRREDAGETGEKEEKREDRGDLTAEALS